MLLLRLLLVLSALVIAVAGGLYIFTREPRYLRFAAQTARLIVLVLLVFGVVFLIERYVLVGWRILV